MAGIIRKVGKAVIENIVKPIDEIQKGIEVGQDLAAAGKVDPAAPLNITENVIKSADETPGINPLVEQGRTLDRNLNLINLDSEEPNMDVLLDNVSHYTDNAGYEKVSFEDQRQLVEDADDKFIRKHLAGSRRVKASQRTLLNASQFGRAKQMLLSSTENLLGTARELADKHRKGLLSKAELFNFQRTVYRHISLQSAVQGEQRELARALGYMRDTQRPMSPDQLDELISATGGEKALVQRIKSIANAADGLEGMDAISAINKTVNKTKWMQSANAFVGWRTLQLLTSPVTHSRNLSGNAVVALASPVERFMAGMVGTGKNAVRRAMGRESVEQVYMGEGMQMYYGYVLSTMDAFKMAGRAMKRNQSVFGAAKIDELGLPPPMSVLRQRLNIPDGVAKPFAYFAELTSWPGRALTGEDEFFKVIAFNAELRALSYRQAKSEGLNGRKLWDRVAELQSKPKQEDIITRLEKQGMQGDDLQIASDVQMDAETARFSELWTQSSDFAHYQTFTDAIVAGPAKSVISSTKNPLVKIILPFTKTPINLMSYANERSPLALITPRFYRELIEGGARRDLAVSRFAMGSGVAAYLSTQMSTGNITGAGPSNPALRSTMMASGWRPYSVRIGGRWFSYRGLEPITTMLGTMGNMADAMNYSQDDASTMDKAVLASAAMAESLKDATFMVGLNEFFEAIDNIENTRGEAYISRTIASALPQSSLLRNITKNLTGPEGKIKRNPEHTELWGRVQNEIERITPWLYDNVPPRVDRLGQIPRFDEVVGWDFVSPFRYLSASNPDKEFQMAQDFINVNSVAIGKIRSKITVPGIGPIDLREVEPVTGYKFMGEERAGQGWMYFEYQRTIGEARLNAIKTKINSSEFQKAIKIPELWGPQDNDPSTRTLGDMIVEASDLASVTARNQWLAIASNRDALENHFMKYGTAVKSMTPEGPGMNVERLRESGVDVPENVGGGIKF